MRTQFAAISGILTLGLILGLSGCGKGPEATPVKVGALFAVTGGVSYLGSPEAKTAIMFVNKLNERGGINGRKIQLIVKDSGADPEKAVLLANQFIKEDQVLAIIGPSTSGETMAIKNICQEAKTILISCAAAEDIVNPVASYVFKSAPKDSDAARWIYKIMKSKGISKVGVITSNDGFGMAGRKQLQRLAGENGITIVISDVYDKQATDLTDILTKLKDQGGVQAVINWSVVPAQSLVAKNMKQIGLDVPLFQSHGFGNIQYVQAGGEATNGTLFPCGRLLIADELPNGHPQKAVLIKYKNDYESQYKENVSSFGGHAYDALLILTEALKKAGSPDREKVRDAIENLTGIVGTAGVFNFSPEDHNGLSLDTFEMLTVKDGKFVISKN